MCSVSCCIAEKGENLVALGIFNGTSFSKGEGAFVSLARATLQTSPLELASKIHGALSKATIPVLCAKL